MQLTHMRETPLVRSVVSFSLATLNLTLTKFQVEVKDGRAMAGSDTMTGGRS